MKLVQQNGHWEIEGPESDRARIAFAVLSDDGLTYQFADCAAEESVRP